jgi:hypothetical protein
MSALIFALKSDDWMAIFVSLFLMTFSVGRMLERLGEGTGLGLAVPLVSTVAYASFILFFYLFPNGRFVPGWTRFLAPLWAALIGLAFFFPRSQLDITTLLPWSTPLLVTGAIGTGAYAQIYRSRHVANPVERQQIKWIVYGVAVILVLNVVFTIPAVLDPTLELGRQPAIRSAVFELVVATVTMVQLLIIPTSVGLSILRYRLWNIDVIISHTLVYVPLTAILAGVYAAVVALLQKIFVALTGQQSDAAIVLTTLVLTASFTPLKNSLQSAVDRRFKEAPDNTRKLKALSEQVQTEIAVIDPPKLARRLLDEATAAFKVEGAITLEPVGNAPHGLTYCTQGWRDADAHLTIPLQAAGKTIGWLRLGPRRGGQPYAAGDTEALRQVAEQVALALSA